jgi:hypothetical protein
MKHISLYRKAGEDVPGGRVLSGDICLGETLRNGDGPAERVYLPHRPVLASESVWVR